jgi:hypothetical protein
VIAQRFADSLFAQDKIEVNWSGMSADEKAAYLTAAGTILFQPQAVAWRLIDTAPKDGTEIWAFNGEQARMVWVEGDQESFWLWADELLDQADPMPEPPTHWMPMPADPSSPLSRPQRDPAPAADQPQTGLSGERGNG